MDATRHAIRKLLVEANTPELLFHGTTLPRLQALKNARWEADELFLTDQEQKAWEYAELRAQEDDVDDPILLGVDASRLEDLQVDPGSGPEEWEQEMGQWTYSGPLRHAIVKVLRHDGETGETVEVDL